MIEGKIEKNIVLAPYTTYKIGGSADYFVSVENKEELLDAITFARSKNLALFILGLGANVLISDKGFRGLVILNRANKVLFEGDFVTAESGVLVSDLIEKTAKNNLSGFEHFAGIPSTIGGAIKQNLHFLTPDRKDTFYLSQIVEKVEVVDKDGKIKFLENEDLKFGYDESLLHKAELIALSATFELVPMSGELIRMQIEDNLKWRKEKHPDWKEFPSCGSVFKKIDGVGAGRLIEQVGIKGKTFGKIQVSPQHANFLVNLGGATAMEVYSAIIFIQKEVKEETGYLLEPEITFVGEF